MKKLFCVLSLGLFSASALLAQETSFGVKAGLNIASLETSNNDFGGKAGLHVGGLAHIHLSPHFALQPELVYSMQGGKDGDNLRKFNYVNIPLLVQYMTNDGFRIQTGPQLGLLTMAKTQVGDVEVNVKDNLSATDFSWAFGVGYLFPQGIGIDGRFNLGLNNIDDDNSVTVKNRVFQVGVFYQFMRTAKAAKK